MPRKQRRRAWGSIKPVVPNKKYILRWMEDTPEGRRRRCETFYGTYREADRRLAEIRVARAGDDPAPTVGQAYRAWYLPGIERRHDAGELSDNSFRLYTRTWDCVVEERWGDVPLGSVRPADVQEWLLAQKRGNAEVALVVLRAIGAIAERYEVAPNKFAAKYALPPKGGGRRKDVLRLAEADGLFRELRGARCEAPFILACFGSCRTGESLGVRADEVRGFEHCGLVFAVAPIERQMEHTGHVPVETLKTAESRRAVCVPPPYSERLLEIARERAEAGVEWMADRGGGLPMNRGALGYAWRREAGAAVPFSNLRNSWRTFAQLEWGVSGDTLELLMGHKLPGVTGSHYMRPSGDALARRFAREFAASFEGLRENKGIELQNTW